MELWDIIFRHFADEALFPVAAVPSIQRALHPTAPPHA
jgi:hypothetical protein